MKKYVQTDSEWQEEMSQKIIDEIQCELYLDMPFMKLALSALSPKVNEQLYSMATDGTYIYYNPIRLIDIFKKNGMYLNRAYLHSVLHCLFFHLWTKGERDEFLWNTACDIMVEYTIDIRFLRLCGILVSTKASGSPARGRPLHAIHTLP